MTSTRHQTTSETPQVPVAIGLGSNLGNRLEHLEFACAALGLLAETPIFRSAVYETQAVDCPEPRPFLNAAVAFKTSIPADQLLGKLHQIEDQLGRARSYRNAPRPLDLDLLYYGASVRRTPPPILPHPRMHQRGFVLIPLADITPGWSHPTLHQTVGELTRTILATPGQEYVELAESQWQESSSNHLQSGDLTTRIKAATML